MDEYWKTTYSYGGQSTPIGYYNPMECPNEDCEETGADFELDVDRDVGADFTEYNMECNACGQKWKEIHRCISVSVLRKGK